MLDIRRLDPTADHVLFEQMYSWLLASPCWRQDTEAVFATVDHDAYISATHNPERIDIGVFENDVLIANVTFTIRAKHTYEVHLEAVRGADLITIITAGRLIRDQIFGWHGAEVVYAWVPRRNLSVKAILEAIGFHSDGVSMFRSTPRGHVTEWVKLSIEANYGQQQTEDDADTESSLQRDQHVRLDDPARVSRHRRDAEFSVSG